MDFDIYCDESRPDLFATQSEQVGKYMLIGGVWLESSDRDVFKAELKDLRTRHGIFGEFKWRAVAPSKLSAYLDLVDWFIGKGDACRFRCIVVDAAQVNLSKFHESDQELGFYKFYYQLLHHWILDFNTYSVFIDHKRNRDRERLKVLHRCLQRSNITSELKRVQALDSADSVFIQLADVLTGAVAYRVHESAGSAARTAVVERLERGTGRSLSQATSRSLHKFNVFKINLSGGW